MSSCQAQSEWDATEALTVFVISAEHTSQMYLTPPSVPRVTVFFLMTPISTLWELRPQSVSKSLMALA